MRTLLLSLILFLVSSLSIAADVPSNAAKPNGSYSAEQVRADLTQLYQNLQAASYDLYAHTSKEEYDAAYQTLMRSITAPMTQLEVHKLLMRFVALADIAHTRIDFPIDAFREFVGNDGKTLPYEFNLSVDGIVISANYGGLDQVQVGDRIIAVNGQNAEDWLQDILTYVAADDDRLARVLAEPMLSPLLWLVDGEQASYQITLQRGHAEPFTVQQPSVGYLAQIEAASTTSSAAENSLSAPREYRMIDQIGYLKPGAFYNIDAESDAEIWQTDAFFELIDNAFSHFVEAQAQAIIIDVRDNSGGSNSFSDYMLAWFADRPFRFASEFRVKVSDLAEAANNARLTASDAEDSINRQLARLYQSHQPGEVVLMPLLDSAPHPQPRTIVGKNIPVYVLINRYSYSNAVSVAAIVQDYEFATVIGEATADYATTYAAMEHFRLPHSNIQVGFPKAHIIRANGDTTPAGVQPDIALDCEADLACVVAFVEKHLTQISR